MFNSTERFELENMPQLFEELLPNIAQLFEELLQNTSQGTETPI